MLSEPTIVSCSYGVPAAVTDRGVLRRVLSDLHQISRSFFFFFPPTVLRVQFRRVKQLEEGLVCGCNDSILMAHSTLKNEAAYTSATL